MIRLPERREETPVRLPYLDGLRALASLYVVLFHAGVGFGSDELPPWARIVRRALSFGHHAVAVFIVLSGYCLMLPVVRSQGQLSGGIRRYLMKRAARILPPYYAALLLSLLLIWLLPVLSTHTGSIWDDSTPLGWGAVLSHLLLFHNVFPSWIYRINGPLWSVATEWQIYFFFPIMLLPIWRRAGMAITALVGFAVGCAPIWLAPVAAARWIPWYLGLFTLGMYAASIGFSERSSERYLRERAPWKIIFAVLTALCALGGSVLVKAWFRYMPISDTVVGAATASLLVCYTQRATSVSDTDKPPVLRFLESRIMVGIGHFSYSLYLTHLPIVALCYYALLHVPLSGATQMLVLIGVSVPTSLLGAYIFFRAIERRFVRRRPDGALVRAQGAIGAG